MQVQITGRHFDLPDSFKIDVNEKLTRLSRYSNSIETTSAVFSQERFSYISEIIMTGRRLRLTANGRDEGLEASFNKSLANIENQLKRFRAKAKGRKGRSPLRIFKNISLRKIRAKNRPEARIIKTDYSDVKPMSPEEAALELDLFKNNFIVFRNFHDDNVNVLYRRKDGNYGLIEP